VIQQVTSDDSRLALWRSTELCKSFLKLPDVADAGKRELYVSVLVEQFPAILAVERHDTAAHDVFALVQACLRIPGALRVFWGFIKQFQTPDGFTHDLDAMVEAADPIDLLSGDDRGLLLEMLREADQGEIAAAYRYVMRSRQEEWLADTADLDLVVRRVESINAIRGRLPPIFTFVDYISHRSLARLKLELHDWMDEVARHLHFAGDEAVRDLCRSTLDRLPAARRYYFVAKIVPDEIEPERYFLSTWRQHADSPEEPTYEAETSAELPEVVRTVSELIARLPSEVSGLVEDLFVELILPRSLITAAADQWLMGDEFPMEIGMIYPVVIRSLERLQRPEFHGRWAVKWQWLKEHDDIGREAVEVIESHSPEHARTLRGRLLAGEPPAAVIMRTPLPANTKLTSDGFGAGLYGGAPVMIWCRSARFADELQAAVLTFIDSDGVMRLPQHIRQLRLAKINSTDGDHLGRHIALAFEDFDRIPEQFLARTRFITPQQREATAA
jgi:NTP-dependent ternary conflict system VMAP-like protein/effector-associated domain 2 (EAD2)-containing protein